MGSATSALTVSKCENFDIFSLKFDSLTLKTHFISLRGVSKRHFSCPFASGIQGVNTYSQLDRKLSVVLFDAFPNLLMCISWPFYKLALADWLVLGA